MEPIDIQLLVGIYSNNFNEVLKLTKSKPLERVKSDENLRTPTEAELLQEECETERPIISPDLKQAEQTLGFGSLVEKDPNLKIQSPADATQLQGSKVSSASFGHEMAKDV